MIARFLFAALLLASVGQAQAVWVRLMGLGPNQAEFQVNRSVVRVMRPGSKSPEGLRLVSITANAANVEANGFAYRMTLGQTIEPMVVLRADRSGHFITDVIVNGRASKALVDTGATGVSFSQAEAVRLGLPFRQGKLIKTRTAAGESSSYLITLDTIQVGAIALRHVPATVSVLQDSPPITLLGMSFLRRVTMVTEGDTLRLTQE